MDKFGLRRSFTKALACGAGVLLGMSAPSRAQPWQPVPLVKQSTRDAGFVPGGEGGQWPRALVVSATDPNFLLFGTDVGGVYRSLDGGARWQVCMVGWSARGGNAFAIDPRNPNRVLGVGGNSVSWQSGWGPASPNGVYLSTDKAASWRQVLPRLDAEGGHLAYDKSSYDAALGYCRVVYFASRADGLWKTRDGGTTWSQINAALSNTRIKVHPTLGTVYVASGNASDSGFWRSVDGGVHFTRVNTNPTHGLDVVDRAPNNVYLSRGDKVLRSADAGLSFQPVGTNTGLPDNKPCLNITVSPADPSRMACWYRDVDRQWDWRRYYTTDGGNRWRVSAWDNTHSILPFNVRDGLWAYHPAQADVVWGVGGDWITRSANAGATFAWAGNGQNAIMVGGLFQFSPSSPHTICLAFQDYNGAFSLDNGRTWNLRDISGNGWGGYCYGGYAVDGQVMWAGDAPSWGGTRQLKVSRDGGTTWIVAKNALGSPVTFAGPDASFSAPTDPNVCFASNWRSADKGLTWTTMPDCEAVYTASPVGGRTLYGKKANAIVQSTNKGATWTTVATVPGGFSDLAYDHVRNRFYVASQDRLKRYQNGTWTTLATPVDQYGGIRVRTVAVDPVDPTIVYAGNHKDVYSCHNAVVRSTDAGATWTNLHVRAPLSSRGNGGPHEVQCIRVHPVTREAWASGQCFGMWKIAPPRKLPPKTPPTAVSTATFSHPVFAALQTNLPLSK